MALGPVGQLITQKLVAELSPLSLKVIDESQQHVGHAGAHPMGESHFRVRIVAPGFSGKIRVARHRMVNEVLGELMRSRVHALAIEAVAPEEDLHFVELDAAAPDLIDLLNSVKLPADDLAGKTFIGMMQGDGVLAAAAGLDMVPPYALLRSVAVRPQQKGQGLGRVMTLKMLGEARNAAVREVYLLTASATAFFEMLGFEPVARSEVPPEIQQTSQFRGNTCAGAQAMRLRLAASAKRESP
jgi:BolA protein